MQSYTAVYESVLTFHLLPLDEINRAKSVLVQIFSTYGSYATAEKIAGEARIFFPDAHIVGVSAFETIHHHKARETGTLIVVTAFESVRLRSHLVRYKSGQSDFERGMELAKKCFRRDSRLLLCYADGLHTSPDSLLEGITSVTGETPVAGVLAADRGDFYDTYLLYGDRTVDRGALLVSLESPTLQVGMERYAQARGFGPTMTVTESDFDVVKTIDGRPAQEVWKHYLGASFLENFPENATDICLKSEESPHLPLLRTATHMHSDGSIRFAGTLPAGSRWRFSRLSVPASYTFCPPAMPKNRVIETIFIFSDTAQALHKNLTLHDEVLFLSDIAPTCGLHGFGQFFAQNGISVTLNQTMVAVALSESQTPDQADERCAELQRYGEEIAPKTAEVLSHIGEVMLGESALLRGALELLMEEFDEGVLLYDRGLSLITASAKAQRLLGLSARLEGKRDLTLLDPWIVKLLEKGIGGRISMQVGKVIDPLDGAIRQIRISTLPIKADDTVEGAVVFVTDNLSG